MRRGSISSDSSPVSAAFPRPGNRAAGVAGQSLSRSDVPRRSLGLDARARHSLRRVCARVPRLLFDVRVYGGLDAFRAGDGIELNGVTSQATHIYDPSTPLRQAIAC